jgi:hypothetical protein
VQAEVPAASTTAAGKVELATDAEAVAGTSATLAVTPRGANNALISPVHCRFYGADVSSVATVGTGGSNIADNATGRRTFGPTSSGIGSVRAAQTIVPDRGLAVASNINWGKRIELSARIIRSASSISANSTYYYTLGDVEATLNDPAVRAIGIRVVGTSAMEILAHDGTSLTTFTTSFTPALGQAFDLMLVSNASGTVEAFVNDSSVGSTTGGPQAGGSGGNNRNTISVRVSNNASFTADPSQYTTYLPTVFIGT